MREIRFRAWDTVQNKYLYPWPYGFSIFGEVTCFDLLGQQLHESGRSSILGLNDLVIEQFTGLLDKNGRGIYEGDIVRIQVEDTPFGVHEIYWDDELCSFEYRMSDEPFNAQFYMDREILGNIHENPELLTT